MWHQRIIPAADFTALAAYMLITVSLFLLPYPTNHYWSDVKVLVLASGLVVGFSLAGSIITTFLALRSDRLRVVLWLAALAAVLPAATDLALWVLGSTRFPTFVVWAYFFGA